MTVLLAQTKLFKQKQQHLYHLSKPLIYYKNDSVLGGLKGTPLFTEFTFYSGLEVGPIL